LLLRRKKKATMTMMENHMVTRRQLTRGGEEAKSTRSGASMRRASACLHAAAVIAALATLAAVRAEGAGGTVLLKTDNVADGYYYGLGGTSVDRYITEYRLGDAPLSSIVCGARVFELNQGTTPPLPMGYELRREDPANPGYPNLGAAGLIAAADPGSTGPCVTGAIVPRIVTFGGGSGVTWPSGNHYLCAIEPVHGSGGLDFCGVLLDTSSAAQGASKVWSGGAFMAIPWNHFLEENVATASTAVFRARYHGNRRFPADPGATVLYANRPNAAGTTTDDRLRLTFSVDNNTALPLPLILEFSANLTGIVPGGGILPLTRRFRPVGGGGGPIVNPISVAPGRTIFRLEVPAALPRRATALAPLNIPFTFRAVDAVSGAQYALITQDMGLRATPGEPDDAVPEAFVITRSPSSAGDALAVRYAGIDLPRSAPYRVSGVQLVGGEIGGTGLSGFDAVELRLADPVLPDTPDLSPTGLLTRVGVIDGLGDIPMGPAPWFRTLDVPDFTLDPTQTPSSPTDVYAHVLLLPGSTIAVATALGADRAPGRTLLGNSMFSLGAAVPYTPDPAANHMIRLLIGGRYSTLPGDDGAGAGAGAFGGPSPPGEFAFESGRCVAIDRFGRRIE
jgi:hypothetical protein